MLEPCPLGRLLGAEGEDVTRDQVGGAHRRCDATRDGEGVFRESLQAGIAGQELLEVLVHQARRDHEVVRFAERRLRAHEHTRRVNNSERLGRRRCVSGRLTKGGQPQQR